MTILHNSDWIILPRILGLENSGKNISSKFSGCEGIFFKYLSPYLLCNTYYSCKLEGSPLTKFNEEYINNTCNETLKIRPTNGYSQQSFIHFVRDAVYAFAHALNNMHLDLCKGIPGLCPAMMHIDGNQTVKYLKNVTFKGKHLV